MHPALDRPHPDCQEPIQALLECHEHFWVKFTGGCGDAKTLLDQCLRAEKKRLLAELNQDLPERQKEFEQVVKTAFGKEMTFSEYLAKDKEYQAELAKKEQGEQSSNSNRSWFFGF
jgi:COX assembly protein 2